MGTRFRAYQLGNEGSSFSYSHDGKLSLIEARLTTTSVKHVFGEMQTCGSDVVEALHLTSWDLDHCQPGELEIILEHLKPKTIEYPGYEPETESGREALRQILRYAVGGQRVVGWSPPEITALSNAASWSRSNVLYWPKKLMATSNDNSTIKLFRSGEFTVLSLGDVESVDIAQYLMADFILRLEVDVMILAHHGADNGFTTTEFVRTLNPTVAICSSNYDNQYEHPRQEIRDILFECGVPIFTTKTGDVLIESVAGGQFRVTNLIADSTEVSSVKHFYTKRHLAQRSAA